jgi:DNA-binding beta-propeller fold protein YncE
MSSLLQDYTPKSIAVTDEKIFIAGDPVRGALVLDREYNFLGWLTAPKKGHDVKMDGDPQEFNSASITDVVAGKDGRLYLVSLPLGRIFVLDRDLEFLFAFGTKGGSPGKLSQAKSLAVDVERQAIYVVDYMRHAVNVYDYEDGAYLFEVGGLGTSPGWFQYPIHVAVDRRGNLIVADYFNSRIQVLFVQ